MKQSTSFAQVATNLLNVLQGYTKGIRFMLVILTMFVLSIGQMYGYTITFNGSAGESTSLSTSTKATEITGNSPYVTGNLVTATKVYGATSNGVKLGTQSAAGTIKFNLSTTGQVTPTSIVVNCKLYNSSKSATLKVNGSATQSVPSSSGNLTFAITSSITYIELASSKYIWVKSVTVNTATGSTTYTVTYDKNGATSGTVPTDATNYTSGATVTVKSNSGNLAKTGYTFGGWNTNSSGTGTNYTAGSGTFTIADNTTLYAKWTVNTHTLNWDVNGGNALTGTYTQGNVAYGATITKPSDPTRTGHTFKGWSIDGTNIVTPASTMPDNDLTYIALWTPLTQYTVKWMVNGIKYTEGNPTASVYEGAKWSSLTLPTAPNPNDYCGKVFAGWTTTNIGSTGLDKDNDATAIQNLNLMTSENKSSKTNTITGDITFYAVFADYAD